MDALFLKSPLSVLLYLVNLEEDNQMTVYVKYLCSSPYGGYRGSIGVAPVMQYTQVHNKKSNTQWSSPNVVKVIFHTLRNCS